MNEYYYYGLAAMMYLTSCWAFAAIRWWHTCRAPKERHTYIWPDRKLQVLLYSCATLLLPYTIDPTDEAAWMLIKCYYPATYFFYCGMLLLCFFGTVKQWSSWRTVSWVAAVIVIATMLVPILNAWLPFKFISAEGIDFWHYVVSVESVLMMAFSGIVMWQVWHWLHEARDANYSNPEDFPIDYARRVWVIPILLTPFLWPAFLFNSPALMAVQHVFLAAFNIVFLITVLPVWRRMTILASTAEDDRDPNDDSPVTSYEATELEKRTTFIAEEIEHYLVGQKAYLDPHLKIDDVVAHTSYSRSYVSQTFQRRFKSFADYVNKLRLAHYEQYTASHPEETKESAAQSSGFSSYNAYYRAKRKTGK